MPNRIERSSSGYSSWSRCNAMSCRFSIYFVYRDSVKRRAERKNLPGIAPDCGESFDCISRLTNPFFQILISFNLCHSLYNMFCILKIVHCVSMNKQDYLSVLLDFHRQTKPDR